VNILVDENIPLRTVQALRAMGHTVKDVRGTDDEGADDDVIWQRVQRESAVLVTTDKGFTKRRGETHWGILAICLRRPNRAKIHRRVLEAFAQFPSTEWRGLTVFMRDTAQRVWRASG
jgi:predicted nuclease of predicted toxin-antitoxin system